MNPKRLRMMGATVGLAFCLAAGSIIFMMAGRPALAKEGTAASGSEPGASALRALSDAFNRVSDQVKPCVVSIYSEKRVKFRRFEWPFSFNEDSPFRWFFGQGESPNQGRSRQREYEYRQGGLGSGIIVDKEGHILTNYHVVKDVDEIKVILADKRTFPAEIAGTDPTTDLAVIKIKGKVPRDLPVADLGDSDVLRVGDWVLTIGAPFGYLQTVTHGIISATGRGNVGVANYEDFIQTDAPINPGNSGGPLVSLRGEVVGINTVIATSLGNMGAGQSAGVGFAIPINMAKRILPILAKGGQVRRGLLGIIIQEIDKDMAHEFGLSDTKGALVAQVNKDSAAEKAGIKVGDVIVRYDGHAVENTGQLRNLVAETTPGAKVDITVVRDGKERTFKAQVGEFALEKTTARKSEEGENTPDIGVTIEPLAADKAKELGYDNDKGVLVTDVDAGSPAAMADIQAGDLITEVNHEKAASVDEFRNALAKAKGQDTVLLLVKRKDASRFVVVRLK
jgi:serine protease Do